jgi:hypothetical protein
MLHTSEPPHSANESDLPGSSGETRVTHATVRFVLPFEFGELKPQGMRAIDQIRQGIDNPGFRPGPAEPVIVWEPQETRSEQHPYRRDVLPHVEQAIFEHLSTSCPASRNRGHRHYALSDSAKETLFPTQSIRDQKELRFAPRSRNRDFVICRLEDAELFLSEFGFGLLSVEFKVMGSAKRSEHQNTQLLADLSLDQTRVLLSSFLHDASQALPKLTGAFQCATAYPTQPANRREGKEPLKGTLSSTDVENGERFSLTQLMTWLLPFPWKSFQLDTDRTKVDVVPKSGRLGAYTVLRVASPRKADFSTPEVRETVSDFLQAMCELSPDSHPGWGSMPTVPNAVLTRQHWSACGTLGAAHMILDQGHSFDSDRFDRANRRYFLPWILALHQRWQALAVTHKCEALIEEILHHATHENGGLNHDTNINEIIGIRAEALKDLLIRFSATADFEQFSTREAVNQWYHTARKAQHSGVLLAKSYESLKRLDDTLAAKRSEQLIETNVATQKKLEWAEVMLFAIYITEWMHIVGAEAGFGRTHAGHSFMTWSLAASLLVGGVIGFFILKPMEHRKFGMRLWPLVIGIVGLLAWFLFGMFGPFSKSNTTPSDDQTRQVQNDHHSATPANQAEQNAEH